MFTLVKFVHSASNTACVGYTNDTESLLDKLELLLRNRCYKTRSVSDAYIQVVQLNDSAENGDFEIFEVATVESSKEAFAMRESLVAELKESDFNVTNSKRAISKRKRTLQFAA